MKTCSRVRRLDSSALPAAVGAGVCVDPGLCRRIARTRVRPDVIAEEGKVHLGPLPSGPSFSRLHLPPPREPVEGPALLEAHRSV